MKADLIIIGNELLNGKIHDLNTQILATSLLKKGIKLRKSQIIPDDVENFGMLVDQIKTHSQLLFISGGLGPTKDDTTKNMLAEYFNLELVENEAAFNIAKAHYDRDQRQYDKELTHYHLLPREFTPLFNPIGYAPGIFCEQDSDFKIFALPGVPQELEKMLEDVIVPNYLNRPNKYIEHVTYRTWGVPESKIFSHYCPELWDQLSPFGKVSSLPHTTGVDIGVTIEESSQSELKMTKDKIHHLISQSDIYKKVWHQGHESLEEVLIVEAKEKKLTIGLAESCTGGLCASRITDIAGSSAIFYGSIVSYANEVKKKSLDVSAEVLENFGAVSVETAQSMAFGAKEKLGVDIAVTTTGIAGPGGGSPIKPVGTVAIGVAYKKVVKADLYHLHGDRKTLKKRFSDLALMTLLKTIRNF